MDTVNDGSKTSTFFSFLIATLQALDLLNKYGQVNNIDGTFSLIREDDYQLVILMINVDGIYTPVAWLITDTKQEAYAKFLKILHDASGSRFYPSFIYCGYEDSLRSGCRQTFPRAQLLGDAFH